MKLITILLGISALFVAFNAAFFSVTGLSKLFAGASISVIIMAASLEFSKLVAAAFLHNYWKRLNFFLKTYLTIGVVVLVIITSAGIYGFLTSAYQVTADQLSVMDRQTELLELRKERFSDQLNTYTSEQIEVVQSITELNRGLSSGNVVQYIDQPTGQLITTTSASARRSLETQLQLAQSRREYLTTEIRNITDSITQLDIEVINIQSNSELASELGPLRYISEITNQPINRVVNWFALLIIFVFDPLAIALVIAFNVALNSHKLPTPKNYTVYHNPLDTSNKRTTDFTSTKSEQSNELENKNQYINNVSELGKDLHSNIPNQSFEKRSIDLDGDGIVDGYDTNGDGMIDDYTPRSSKRAQYAKTQKPYYAKDGYDWNNYEDWVYDQNAVNYWHSYVKNKPNE